MSIGSTLPPQAYTREILAVAFNWLQGQPESIKKLAVTPDALVGLYMRAQRFGQSEAPVSAQNFVSDLKNLAEGLRQFEDEGSRTSTVTMAEYTQRAVHFDQQVERPPSYSTQTMPPMHAHQANPYQAAHPGAHQSSQMPPPSMRATPPFYSPNQVPFQAPFQQPSPAAGDTGYRPQPADFAPSQGPAAGHAAPRAHGPAVAAERPTHEGDGIVLTESGREMTREIRRRMNLSSDTEAANMMIAVAYKTLQNLLR